MMVSVSFISFTAEVSAWDLTLYGTATPPAVDIKQETDQAPIVDIYPEELDHNSIDESSANSWKGGAEVNNISFNMVELFCNYFECFRLEKIP